MNPQDDVCGEECYTMDRRAFGAFALAAGLIGAAGAHGEEQMVVESDVLVTTSDGVCDAHLAQPMSEPGPGVLVWPDVGGLRPVFRAIGARLARQGYTVLTVNPFYRALKGEVPADLKPEDRPRLREGLAAPGAAERDAQAFVAFLDNAPMTDKGRKIGVTGYCMGGALSFRSAAAVPGRVGAGASFHGGGLVTDQPTSPHLLIPRIKARYLICIADNDDQKDPAAKETLRRAFAAAGNSADIEVYAGANHGWCVPGSRVYDEAQAERAWTKLLGLLQASLTTPA